MERKRSKLNIIFHLVLAIELAVFQFVWPLAIARAEMMLSDQPTAQQQSDDNAGSGNSNSENTNTGSNSANGDTNSKNDEPAWKSCGLTKDEEDLIEKDKCEKCQEETKCEEIKKCLEEFVDIENTADVKNEVGSTANTGENEINSDTITLTDPDTANQNDNASLNADVNNQPANSADADLQNHENGTDAGQENSVTQPQENQTPDPTTVENNSDNSQENEIASGGTDSDDETNPNEDNIAQNENNDRECKDNSAEITTSDAAVEVNIVNEVNTNIIGENTEKITENIDGVYNGDINLLDKFNDLLNKSADGTAESGNELGVAVVNIDNVANVENDAAATADTGKNSISGEGDSALVLTGNATAIANVVNFVNVNLIGNNWLFATINIFGDWIGDLIVPGEGLLEVPEASGSQNASIVTENNASVVNNANSDASTGENSVSGENKNAKIKTGASSSASVVKNVINTTIVKNNWFFLMINNAGSWIGKAIHWDGDSNQESFSYDFDENKSWEKNLINWFASIFIRNRADVRNTVNVEANTGGNEIAGDFENGSIKTGDAQARANILNFVNMNIIGSNWIFATVNIFGSWKGNVDFAYPDLAISVSDGRDEVRSGDKIHYVVSYENVGRADCDGVDIKVTLPKFVDLDGNSGEKDLAWHLPGLKAGEKRTFSIDGTVSQNIGQDPVEGEAIAELSTTTKEVELANNTASDGTIFVPLSENSDNSGLEGNSAENQKLNYALTISREISDKKVKPGEIVKHTIFVKNTSDGTLADVTVQDNLKNKEGQVGTYEWKIGDLEKGKTAKITYSLLVNAGASSGEYRSKANAFGFDPEKNQINSSDSKIVFRVSEMEDQEDGYYYTYGQNYPPVQYIGEDSGLVNAAEAAGPEENALEGKTLGSWTNPGICLALPLVFWLMALLAYAYILNWALFPKKKKIKQ